jgi:hypothetical protein
MHDRRGQEAQRFDQEMTFGPAQLLAAVSPAEAPRSARGVLTDWLSRIAALAVGCLPARCRASLLARQLRPQLTRAATSYTATTGIPARTDARSRSPSDWRKGVSPASSSASVLRSVATPALFAVRWVSSCDLYA